jgi:hypothetical protein
MLVSHLFMRHNTPAPRFAPGLFVALMAAFTILGQTKPIVGLTGLGVTLVAAGTLVELNRRMIWENYRKTFRKTRGLKGLWTKPAPIYYTINVVILWPLIIVLGILTLWAAYILS